MQSVVKRVLPKVESNNFCSLLGKILVHSCAFFSKKIFMRICDKSHSCAEISLSRMRTNVDSPICTNVFHMKRISNNAQQFMPTITNIFCSLLDEILAHSCAFFSKKNSCVLVIKTFMRISDKTFMRIRDKSHLENNIK